MSRDTAHLCIFNTIGLALVAAAYLQGILVMVYMQDHTRISWAVSGVLVIGIAAAFCGNWKAVNWIAGTLPVVGMIGTIWGFMLLAPLLAAAGSSDERAAIVIAGIPNALHGTFASFVGYLYLRTMSFLIKGDDI